MSQRKEQRFSLEMPVRISGLDADGRLFEQEAETLDVTTSGARISGIRHRLHRGCIITIQRRTSKARFRVMWVGEDGGPDQGQIGVQLIESGKFIWGQVIPRIFGDRFRGVAPEPAPDLSEIPLRAILKADPSSFD